MHARVTTAYGPPDKAAEGIKIHKESVVPETRQHAGYKGTLLLVDRTAGKSIQITLWETEDHAKAVEQQGHYRKQTGKFSHLVSAPPFEEDYEVAVLEVESGEATTHARVTLFLLRPDADQEELITIFRNDVLAEMRQLPGSKGGLLLLDRAAGRALTMGMWESAADMKAAEQNGTYQKQVAKLTHLFTTPTLREIFEVTSHDVG